jgi:processive 1,2-diacylglycerol beta-glucosyltransferase
MPSTPLPTLDLVYFDAGGGHRAAAEALHDTIAAQGRPWQVRLIDLVQVLDPQARFQRLTGLAPVELYNRRLRRGWTLGMTQELRVLQGLIRLWHEALTTRLARHWAATEPDLVVSLIPNFNRALAQSVGRALPGVPFVTVMTDLADLPPHFWIEPGERQHVICGTPHAYTQGLAAGVPARDLSLVSGMVLRPAFHVDVDSPVDRAAAFAAWGLDPARPAGAVMFGGQGSATMRRIARALPEVQLIHLCGHNEALARQLRAMRRPAPQVALGYTREVAQVLRTADFLIGKPGPGSLSEAVQCGLPLITFRNAWTMPQERWNTEWVERQGLGLVLPSTRAIAPAVERLLAALPAYRERVGGLRNRAASEVVTVLARQLEASRSPRPTALHEEVAG